MKFLERLSIIIFSVIVIIFAGATILISTDIVNISIIEDIFEVLSEHVIATICVSVLLILWSIANIFFKNSGKYENVNGVLLENENGTLLITKDSISNLVENVLKKNEEVKDGNVKVELDSNRGVIININATVNDTTVIKEISTKLQENIIKNVKKATDLDVKEVNIKIKNIDQDKKATV